MLKTKKYERKKWSKTDIKFRKILDKQNVLRDMKKKFEEKVTDKGKLKRNFSYRKFKKKKHKKKLK